MVKGIKILPKDENGHPIAGVGSSVAKKSNSNRDTWLSKYEREFALEILERDPSTGEVTLAMCGLCKRFGRDLKDDAEDAADHPHVAAYSAAASNKRRRKSLKTVKMFKSFRVDNIRSHLSGEHRKKWEEYQSVVQDEEARLLFLQNANLDQADEEKLQRMIKNYKTPESNKRQMNERHLEPQPPFEMYHPGMNKRGGGIAQLDLNADREYSRLVLDRERLEFDKWKFQKKHDLKCQELRQREAELHAQKEFQIKLRDFDASKMEMENDKIMKMMKLLSDTISTINGNNTIV